MNIKLKDLPIIYNVDKLRLYKDNRLIGETWVGSSLRMYIEEKFPHCLDYVIDNMSFCVDGYLCPVQILEIYFK